MPRIQREGTAPVTDTKPSPKQPDFIVIDEYGDVPEHVWDLLCGASYCPGRDNCDPMCTGCDHA